MSIGEPLCFSNITGTGERCESAKGCKSNQMHGEPSPHLPFAYLPAKFNSTKCAAADILRALLHCRSRIRR
jgi:hypothetical protein